MWYICMKVFMNENIMRNFNYYNPVRILFGKGKLSLMSRFIPAGSKVLVTYGGGSIKRNGVYDKVMEALSGYEIVEFGGIEPNPHYETLMKAVAVVKREEVDFMVAVGGGSVIDGTKFIAAAAYAGLENSWELVTRKSPVTGALPFGTVLTLPATSSEMNSGAVITKACTKEKLAFGSDCLFPRFSVLDPDFTFSLPLKQIANGLVDTFVHVVEQYLVYDKAMVSDRFSEALMRNIIELAPRVYKEERDYEAMADFMWTATMGLNGLIACGLKGDWATHMIGHELTALHGLDHAVTLAIVLPGLMRAVKEKRNFKMAEYTYKVWGISPDEENAADKAIARTEAFFNGLNIKTKLSDYGIGRDTVEEIVHRFEARLPLPVSGVEDISPAKVGQILLSVL